MTPKEFIKALGSPEGLTCESWEGYTCFRWPNPAGGILAKVFTHLDDKALSFMRERVAPAPEMSTCEHDNSAGIKPSAT